MKKVFTNIIVGSSIAFAAMAANAETYMVDTEGKHAFIQFRVKHLGYSWLYGRFNDFDGNFDYDEAGKELSNIDIMVDTDSLSSNHAERDKHIRSDDFIDASTFPTASFKTTEGQSIEDGKLTGELTLYGNTQEVTFDVEHIGGGTDPWNGYRNGFQAEATIAPADFGLDLTKRLGEGAATVDLIISIEGIRQ